MESNRKTLWGAVKKLAGTAVEGVKRLAGVAKERVDLDILFRKKALVWKRLRTDLVNLEPTLLGIFNREESTLTVRWSERLNLGDLLESDHDQYRVEQLRPEPLQVSVELDKKTHFIECRVAELKKI